MAFFVPLSAFLAGILIGDFWMNAGVYLVILVGLVMFFWIRKVRILILSVLCPFFGYGYAMMHILSYETQRANIGDMVGWHGSDHRLEGIAGNLISVSEFAHRYKMRVTLLDGERASFDVVLSLPPNLSLLPGDTVETVGVFSFPVDTPAYMAEKQLWNQGIVAEFRAFQTKKTPPKQYSVFVRMREWFDRSLTDIFPRQGYDLLSGILLGQKSQMDPLLREELKASGLMHLMVVSGGNVIMLIVFLSLFIRVFSPWIRIGIIGCTIAAFAILVGGDWPVWRAALMGVIGYVAGLWGYRFPGFILPLGVAVILAFLNPLSLAYDIGLQLSFLSVICIIAWGKKFARFFSFLGPFFSEAFAITLAATIGTLPITLFYFGTFSLLGPLANLFAAPAVPVLMYSGILTLILHTISPTLSYICGYIPWVFLTYLYQVIHIFGQPQTLIQVDISSYKSYCIIVMLGLLLLLLVSEKTHRSGYPES